jgi:hypothetical protein
LRIGKRRARTRAARSKSRDAISAGKSFSFLCKAFLFFFQNEKKCRKKIKRNAAFKKIEKKFINTP